jgi:g-D-glutamyl-meso-diaminopimelate peptidase
MNKKRSYTYEALENDLKLLKSDFPDTEMGVIGKSVWGKNLYWLRLGSGKNTISYNGAHHGMEWLTSAMLMKFAREYLKAKKTGSALGGFNIPCIDKNTSVYIVPMLNPDGVELATCGVGQLIDESERERLLGINGSNDFSHWQANARGVDLNHNYNAGFAEFKAMEPSLGIHGPGPVRFSGDYPESEPETSALCSFIRATDISLLLALHTQGGEIYADYNGYYPPGGAAMAKRMAALCGYTVAKPEPAASYGGLKDWFILEYDRPGFTLECGKGVNPLPVKDAPSSTRGSVLSFSPACRGFRTRCGGTS